MAAGPLTMISVKVLSRSSGTIGWRGDTPGSGAATRLTVGGATIMGLVSCLPQWMTIRRTAGVSRAVRLPRQHARRPTAPQNGQLTVAGFGQMVVSSTSAPFGQ